MLPTPHILADTDARERRPRILALAPQQLTKRMSVTFLLLGLVINAVSVLVILPRAANVLEYNLQIGDLYDLIATNLAQGHGYRVDAQMGETMLREPGYPLLVAAMFKIGGIGVQSPRLACVVLAFGASLLILFLARKVTGSEVVALIAAVLFLVLPACLIAEARAGVEIPCVFTVLLFMFALYRAIEKKSISSYAIAGLLLGLASLVRSEVLLFPLFVGPYCLFVARDWSERGKVVLRMLVLGAATVVIMSPWIIRNYLLVHQIVPTATVAGVAAQEGLYTCKNLSQDGQFYSSQRKAGHERSEFASQLGLRFEGSYYYQFFYTPQDEVAFNRALLKKVSEEYRSNPELLLNCGARNLAFKFWFLGKTPQATRLNMLVQLPLLAAAAGGLFFSYRLQLLPKMWLLLLYLVYVPIVHTGIIAHARHSILVSPFLVILAAVCVACVARIGFGRNSDLKVSTNKVGPRM